jgi:hypothetical protein
MRGLEEPWFRADTANVLNALRLIAIGVFWTVVVTVGFAWWLFLLLWG